MSGTIYWRDISKDAEISLKGNIGERAYYVNGKTVFWHGREAKEAQKWLEENMNKKTFLCIICELLVTEGWYNPKSNEGICQEDLDSHTKSELLDYATGN